MKSIKWAWLLVESNRSDCEKTACRLLHSFRATLTAAVDAAISLSGELCQKKQQVVYDNISVILAERLRRQTPSERGWREKKSEESRNSSPLVPLSLSRFQIHMRVYGHWWTETQTRNMTHRDISWSSNGLICIEMIKRVVTISPITAHCKVTFKIQAKWKAAQSTDGEPGGSRLTRSTVSYILIKAAESSSDVSLQPITVAFLYLICAEV